MSARIQLRRGTSYQWTTDNPLLAEGEPGLDTDQYRLKFGDGVTPWSGLPYQTVPAGPPITAATWSDLPTATPGTMAFVLDINVLVVRRNADWWRLTTEAWRYIGTSAWTSIATGFQNGWSNYGPSYQALRTRRCEGKMVEIEGLVVGGSLSSTIFAFTDQAWWPPPVLVGTPQLGGGVVLRPTAMGASAAARVDVHPNGAVNGVHAGGGTASDFPIAIRYETR